MTERAGQFDLDALIDERATRIVVCCGSGGVGKTTTAAALALRAAERGRDVVVLTIDPARRLAQALGLTELDNTPHEIEGIDRTAGGRLHAMMLDMKRTFDDIVVEHSDPERAQQILDNPFYQSVSASFAGTQEYMAMEKLGQLYTAGTWDLIVVDTPPSRSALDFLDAPDRLGSFLDGRLIRVLSAPAKVGGIGAFKLLTGGVGLVTGLLGKLLGSNLLTEVQSFVAALDSMFGGFRERAEATYQLLKTDGTAFIVVAAPEPDAMREASYFTERLATDNMPLAGMLLNRMHRPRTDITAERSLAAAQQLAGMEYPGGGCPDREDGMLAAALLRLHAERVGQARREAVLTGRFQARYPNIAILELEAQAQDVHDLTGLRTILATAGNQPGS
jgi:anion-transporting  ArsA/GET3 family ATPase